MRKLSEDFGWYLSLKQLAESGVFTKGGMSAMKSAEVADLYEAFTFLAASKAEAKFVKRYQEIKE